MTEQESRERIVAQQLHLARECLEDADAARTLLYTFAKVKSGVVLPAESTGGICTTGRLRHVTGPEAKQKMPLHRLGLTLPRRLERLYSPGESE